MADTHELDGLDPYDLFDRESARIDAFLSTLVEEGWAAPTRCAAWSARDLVGHLAATEAYHHACLDGALTDLFNRFIAEGVTTLADANRIGVGWFADLPAGEVVDRWRRDNAQTRRRLRERDGGEMETSVGAYPVRQQAFHLASELAIHADDLGVPDADGRAGARRAWRVRFSRFALAEEKPQLAPRAVDGGTEVTVGATAHVIDDRALVDAVAGRSAPEDGLAPDVVAALSVMP